MKFSIGRDGITVNTDPQDLDLARATVDVIESGMRLGDAAGVIGRGECEHCGDRGRLRRYNLLADGEFAVWRICADCQATFVDAAEAQATGETDETPGLAVDKEGREEAVEREMERANDTGGEGDG